MPPFCLASLIYRSCLIAACMATVDVWRNLVKGKWWSNAEFASDAEGLGNTNAFYGFYEVIVTVGNTRFTQFVTHSPNNHTIEINLP